MQYTIRLLAKAILQLEVYVRKGKSCKDNMRASEKGQGCCYSISAPTLICYWHRISIVSLSHHPRQYFLLPIKKHSDVSANQFVFCNEIQKKN